MEEIKILQTHNVNLVEIISSTENRPLVPETLQREDKETDRTTFCRDISFLLDSQLETDGNQGAACQIDYQLDLSLTL